MLASEDLKREIRYNKDTGVFTRIKTGKTISTSNAKGYMVAGVRGSTYLLHRLAFLYVEGYFPESCIDHINGNKQDNRWNNLRHVSYSCNNRNANVRKDNRSGVKGVSWNKFTNRWQAQIGLHGKNVRIGEFTSKAEAILARKTVEICLGWSDCDRTSG